MAGKKMRLRDEGSTGLTKLEQGALAPWQQEAAEEARKEAATFQQGLARISFKGGHIAIDGAFVPNDRLPVIIVDAVLEKAYYTKTFVDGEPATPVCYGFHATNREEIAPHPSAPEKQHTQCAGCQWNAFGTAIAPDGSVGRGKRCRDIVRGVAVVYDAKPGALVKSEARGFSIPPTSLKNWGDYVAKIAGAGASFRSVVTELHTVPFKATFKVEFDALGRINESAYMAVKGRQEMARSQLLAPYPALSSDVADLKKLSGKKLKRLKGQ